MIDLNEISKDCLEIARRRESFGGPKADTMNCLKHCGGEIIECGIAFNDYFEVRNLASDLNEKNVKKKWKGLNDPDGCEEFYQEKKAEFESELADIIVCALIIGAREKVNVESALKNCVEKNRKRAEGSGDKL